MMVASLVTALALVAAACGDDDAVDTTTTTTTTTTTAPPVTEPDEVAFDYGVTPAPCPDAVNPGNGCIYLGVISDLTVGPFAPLAVPLTQAQEHFWADVNAQGGLNGFDVIITAENTFDAQYLPDLTVEGYERIAERVLMFAQILGTPQLQAVVPRLVEDNVVTAPATWWSGWAFTDVDAGLVLESGAPYCFEAMNAMAYMAQRLGTDITWALVAFPGDYGGDYGNGAKIAAAQLGLGDPVVEHLQIPFAAGGGPEEAVGALVAAQPDLIVMVTGPTEMATIAGGLFGAGFMEFQILGAAPTWNVALLGSPVLPVLEATYFVSLPWGGWGTDSAGHRAMREAAAANGHPPHNAYIAGWVWQYPVKALLEAALATEDLRRENLVAIAQSLDDVDYEGMLPSRSYVGAANDQVERSTLVAEVFPEAADGLRAVTPAFVDPIVAGFNLAGPCDLA